MSPTCNVYPLAMTTNTKLHDKLMPAITTMPPSAFAADATSTIAIAR